MCIRDSPAFSWAVTLPPADSGDGVQSGSPEAGSPRYNTCLLYTSKDVPKEKLDFLQKMVFESKNLSQKELIPFLMALAQRSRASNITFTQNEMTVIIEAIKKYSCLLYTSRCV